METFQYLGDKPEQPDKTISFVRSLQGADGLFHYDSANDNSTLEQKLEATHYALKILSDLGFDLKRADYLEPTAQTLKQYLQTQLAELPNGSILPPDSSAVSVIADLALMDPLAVDSATRSVIEQGLASLELSNNLKSRMLLLAYMDAEDALNMQFSDSQIQRLRQALQTTMVPELNSQIGMVTEGGINEPAMTLISAQLLTRFAIPYPNQSKLQDNLSKYRIPEGWIMFVIPHADAGITYHALVVADSIGYSDFDSSMVSNYLQNVIRDPTAAENLQTVTYAVRALALLNQKPDISVLQQIQQIAQKRLEQLGGSKKFQSLVDLAFFLESIKGEWPTLLLEPTRQAILDANKTDLHSAETIYKIAMLQTVSHQEVIPNQQLQANLMELLTADGGFKAMPAALTPDLASTFFALDALARINGTRNVDPRKIRQFVFSAQDEYGFTYVPKSTLQQSQFKGTSLENALATHLGFEILEMVQDGVKPSKYGLP